MQTGEFVAAFREAFGPVPELPLLFRYTDEPLRPAAKAGGCFFKALAEARDGRPVGLNSSNIGCGGGKFYTGFSPMPEFVPQFVSLLVMHQMLQPQGAINRILMNWGWIDNPMPFFTDATWARVTVIVINLWVGIPYTIMQVTGILQNIPADQYEAAEIDGANWWQIFTKITMPYIIFVLTPYLITTFTGNVNNFNVIYLLTRGDPAVVGDSAGKTDLLITWLYKLTVDNNDYNLGAVIGIMTFVVLAVVSLITYRSSGSYKNEEAFR